MATPKKEKTPAKYAEKVSIDADFHGAMKLLAHHANKKGTKKVTYHGRNRKAE